MSDWKRESEWTWLHVPTGDRVSKTFTGSVWAYEAHTQGASIYGLGSAAEAMAWLERQRAG